MISKRTKVLILFITILILLALSACAVNTKNTAPDENDLTPITFMAGYKPQANLPFVGAYIAQEKGYFADNGLAVTIEHSPGKGEHLQLLVSGTVQVTTMDAANVLERRADPGLPVVSIALIGQKGQQAFAALADSGMASPKDWEGHIVGYKGTPPPDLFALLAAVNADIDKMELVNVGFDPRVLSEKQVDVYPLFKSNEPYLLNKWGSDIRLWDAADYGVPTLGLTYAATEDYLNTHSKELTQFLNAALKGIQYAQDNPDEAVQIVMQYAGPETDPEHMRFMLETELKDAKNENVYGWQTAEQWQSLADMLSQYDILDAEIDILGAFTTDLLE